MSSFNAEGHTRAAAAPRPTFLPDRLPWAAAVVVVTLLALGLWTGTILIAKSLFYYG